MMKRCILLLLVVLLLTGCSANEEVPVEPAPTASAVPAATVEPAATATPTPLPTGLVRQETKEYQAISASPDSMVELCAKDGALYIRRGESVIPVTINESRGVPDTYGNLAKIHSFGTEAAEDVCWSPDGRYITLWSYHLTFHPLVGYIFDPHVIDTATGEMYLLDTHANMIAAEDGYDIATMIDAEYSLDGQFLYVLLFGAFGEKNWRIDRYDVETLQAQTLGEMAASYCSSLTLQRNGDILLLTQTQWNDPMVLQILDVKNGGWSEVSLAADVKADFFSLGVLRGSAESGWNVAVNHSPVLRMGVNAAALATMKKPEKPKCYMAMDCLLCFGPGEKESAIENAWWIPSLNAPAAQKVSLEDLGRELTVKEEAPLQTREMIPDVTAVVQSALIGNAVLSPDGQSVLLLCAEVTPNGAEAGLLLLRLSDMSLTRLAGIDGETMMDAYLGGQCMAWIGDTVFFGESMENVVAYKLK